MIDVKIPPGLAGNATLGVGPGGAQVQADVPAPPPAPPPAADGFGRAAPAPVAQAQAAAQLTGLAQAPALPAAALAVQAKQIQSPFEVQGRFQAAFAAAQAELLDRPDLPRSGLGQRANEFFTEYARRFVETASGEDREERAEERAEKAPDQAPQTAPEPQRPVTPEQQQELAREFADALRALGFAELENLANGQDGVENAFQLLTSEGKEKFESLAREQKISIKGQFPPRLDGELPEPALMPPPSPPAADAERPAGPAGPAGGGAPPGDLPGTEAPASAQVPDHPVASGEEEDEDAIDPKKRKRRGKNILWSVLGTLRRQDEAVRQAEEKWDRVVVTALLFLLFVVLVTVALVSL